MKKNYALLVLAASLFVTGCASTPSAKNDEKIGTYAGSYDERKTPENSCVIAFRFFDNSWTKFKQINPKIESDEQSFSGGFFKNPDTVFLPVKPGSVYMLKEFKGELSYGNGSKATWEMEFDNYQKYFVINVPETPGIYVAKDVLGRNVAFNASKGKKTDFELIDSSDKKSYKALLKANKKAFMKCYAGTPWEAAYNAELEKAEQ